MLGVGGVGGRGRDAEPSPSSAPSPLLPLSASARQVPPAASSRMGAALPPAAAALAAAPLSLPAPARPAPAAASGEGTAQPAAAAARGREWKADRTEPDEGIGSEVGERQARMWEALGESMGSGMRGDAGGLDSLSGLKRFATERTVVHSSDIESDMLAASPGLLPVMFVAKLKARRQARAKAAESQSK